MQKTCRQCQNPFEISEQHSTFYQKISPTFGGRKQLISPPTLCPPCRLQRRLSWRNEFSLYPRNCDLSGEKILSIYAPESPYKVYSPEAWYSDRWNAKDYGRPFDFSRPFFEQFAELLKEVPLLSLNVQALQNCDYVNQCGWSKNCYLTIEADQNEDSLYSYRVFYVKNVVDCTEVFRSEWCYECIDSESCFNLKYSQLSQQCSDSAFLFDCRGVSNSLGCVGLRQKQYCWFNEQLTKEEYQKRLKAIDLCNPKHMEEILKHFNTLKLQHPRKAIQGAQNENVSGNYIFESKDCTDSFNIRACRDVTYCDFVRESRDCMDYFVWGDQAELIYESQCCGNQVQNLSFCCDCWSGVHDLMYCYMCPQATANCFGCIGLQKSQYCILNKQYPKKEYEELVPRIIEQMKKMGEWGEFFPMDISPFAYNESTAQDYFPLSREQIVAQNLKFRDTAFSEKTTTVPTPTKTWNEIPLKISEVPDSIVKEVLSCESTGKPFRLTAQELKFYRTQGLPLPRLHPFERHKKRMTLRNPRQLWQRTCDKCNAEITTSYAPDRPEKVVCEKCYLQEVY